jgi:mannose-6-phosphate isomerase
LEFAASVGFALHRTLEEKVRLRIGRNFLRRISPTGLIERMTAASASPASSHHPTLLAAFAPFLIQPVFTARIWGFRDLRPWFDVTAESDPIGEVWLTGDHCVVATGPHQGKQLGAVFSEFHKSMLGPDAPVDTPVDESESPLLIKVLFAREKLSVQVHPDDALAQRYGFPRGKTECWYALAAEPGAEVAAGIKPGTTLAQIEAGISGGTLEERLNVLPIAKGDMVYVDAGTVHAIWPGAILLETQQNCDLTYRMYDYGRPRELHVEKSLEATRLETRAGKVAPKQLADRTVLVDADYFRVERIHVEGNRSSVSLRGDAATGLAYLFAAEGRGRISGPDFEPIVLEPRSIVAVPAAAPEFTVEDLGGPSGPLDLIRITPNWPATAR